MYNYKFQEKLVLIKDHLSKDNVSSRNRIIMSVGKKGPARNRDEACIHSSGNEIELSQPSWNRLGAATLHPLSYPCRSHLGADVSVFIPRIPTIFGPRLSWLWVFHALRERQPSRRVRPPRLIDSWV